jgi:hypothetical protein
MSGKKLSQTLLATVIGVCLLAFTGVLSAQGNSGDAFERVKEVQERHTARLMAQKGVVGTAVGLNDNGQHVVLILLETEGVPDIPGDLDGVPVRRVVTGTISALAKPPARSKVPAAPSDLAARAVSSTQINLTWNDNATNETGFKIERGAGTGPDVPYNEIATIGANITSYSDASLPNAGTYTYRLRAYNKFGSSAYSNEASATTVTAPTNPPAAPSGLTATAVGSTQINLTWNDNATNETGFKIERATTPPLFSQIATTGANVTTYSDPGRAPSTTYTYRVRAYNGEGDSEYSNEASATTAAPEPTDPSSRFPRPVPIGVSTGHPSITAGTISCRVTDGSAVYALSNNHVYAASNQAHIGDAVIQPGTYDDGTSPADDIGTLSDFEPIKFDGSVNTIDAAIAVTDVLRLGNSTPSNGYGTPKTAIAVPDYYMRVQKYGRTTGLTKGMVWGLNAAISVDYGSGQYAYFTGQIMIASISDSFSLGGDSGSLIVTDDENCNPVGLLFAGSSYFTYANLIGPVLARFGVTVDGR